MIQSARVPRFPGTDANAGIANGLSARLDMNHLHLLLPGDLAATTGGTLYDRHVVDGLRELGWHVQVCCLDTSFPTPSAQALTEAARLLAGINDHARVLIDGLALGAMPEVLAAQAYRLRLIALVHHPLALETGLDPHLAQALRQSETAALRHVRHVIVTSPYTASLLNDFGVAATRIDVIEPGCKPAALATGSGPGPLHILCVGSLTPRKGHHLLIDALARLTRLDWMLICAGSLERAPDTASALCERIHALGLQSRVHLLGEVPASELAALYKQADLFVLPSLFEGYGMVYAEALAHGLPVLGTSAGAIPDTVPADAGLLVEPGSASALATALERLLSDRPLRDRLAAGARRARTRLPTWQDRARRFAEVLNHV